ncbi:N-methylhydantoinase A/oxoprolinase/acetone carboxylase beta subunit [Murinocardiopsis flavida]|uniref:N-methylhydantoinase A/oxoprolinase/acetone carboxylase beta subunit n=1 Tax=Murinocardiopsis flavida TaxID=645275 RepID=A0A2P8DTJ9_9ACTN|nr:hydantoinase/oxoprolinase family protein [Murinocardiopsis flavida]PSL00546.1 N-methylhydantoinase A/oxoprolinase/acetone carboxylase beta subunit [Murinocardiopsis flavida]
MMREPTRPDPVRIGIDVGGTFTDAVAVSAADYSVLGQVKVPTSHDHADGVAHGIMTALDRLLDGIGVSADDVAFLAHGTTQATNALLEGDVATIGIVGVGSGFDAFATGRLRSLGRLRLDSGHPLPVRYAALRDPEDAAAALSGVDAVIADGAEVIVAVEPFSVDDPRGETAVLDAAALRSVPATATHEITQLYGLAKRARTAALNAGVMPRMLQTADLVEQSIRKAGVSAPLMVMRCDGGVMTLPEMRHRPLLTVLSGPAAGVAGALMGEKVSEGVFLETGGTSTDISVIRRGRVQIRHAALGGKETYLSALDVRTVGIGGGSLLRLGGGAGDGQAAITGVGPRSAHIAGLPYACFADPADLAGARLVRVSPQAADPSDYAVLDTGDRRFALTVTCAANAAGVVPEGDYARSDPDTARIALEPLARALGVGVPEAARAVLGRAADRVGAVVDELIDDYGLDRDVCSLVGGGGGAATVTPYLGERMGLDARIAAHSEVISPLGVALALVRESVERIVPGATHADVLAVRAEAEQAVLRQGADPAGVEVDVTVDPQRNLVTAVATGATGLRAKDRAAAADESAVRGAAAASLGADPGALTEYAANGWYRVLGLARRHGGRFGRFARERTHVRVVDAEGVVRLHSADAQVDVLPAAEAEGRLRDLVAERTAYGDGGAVPPAVWLLLGPKIADLSGVLDPGHLLALASTEIGGRPPDEGVVVLMETRR